MENNAKRTLSDKIISGLDKINFNLAELILLRLARFRYESSYSQGDSEPLISIYIPTYNRAELLANRAIPSILAQTYNNFELVIIGDHCTDKTEELVSKFKDHRIIFYNLPKRGYRYPPIVENHWFAGPVVAANKALELVKGKWIARMDDDDTWTPDHLEVLLKFAQAGNYEFVSALHIEERYGKRQITDGIRMQSSYYNKTNKPIKGNNPKIGSTITWLYRSYLRFIKYNVNCWRKSWNKPNDIDYSVRVFSAGVRMGFLEKVVAYVLPRPNEQTIGSQAYKFSENQKLKHFEFEK